MVSSSISGSGKSDQISGVTNGGQSSGANAIKSCTTKKKEKKKKKELPKPCQTEEFKNFVSEALSIS